MDNGGASLAVLEDVLAVVETGSRPPGGAGVDSFGLPSIGGENLRLDGSLDLQAVRRVPDDFVATMRTGHLEPGDVLINKDGAQTGKVAQYRGEFAEASINEHVFLLRGTDSIQQDYLYHVLRSEETQRTIRRLITGSAQPGLNRDFLKATWILQPPLEEQRRIAEILDAIDETIYATERVIAKHKQIRSGLASDLLHSSASPTWAVKSLGQIGTFFRGSGGTKRDETEEGFPCVRYGDLYTLDEGSIRRTRSWIGPERTHLYTRLNYGDLLFAGSGETLDDIGKSAVNLMRGHAYCGGDVIVLRPAVEIDPSFLGHVADCESSRVQKSRMGSGSTVMHIYGKQLQALVIPVPPLEEQRRIAQILDASDEAIRTEQCELAKLRQIRVGLADDLLSGRVRTVAV